MTIHQTAAAGGDPAAVLAAAGAARDRCDYPLAEQLARRAVVLAEGGPLSVLTHALRFLGGALMDRGRYSLAVRPLHRALALAESDDAGPVLHSLFGADLMRGHAALARDRLAAADRVMAADHPGRVRLNVDRCWMELHAGDYATAERLARTIIESLPAGELRAVAASHVAVACAARRDGAGLDALRALLDDGGAGCLAWPWYGAGWAAALLGRGRLAMELAGAARRIAARTGDEYTRARAAKLVRDL